ncbi:BON domain-containing protein [Rhizobium mesosinicum]|uniref:BON domain-containing protein n=1 Tax=Rhizobium mesosinicum TaxID=335017 RepID=A0ABS7GQW8_9HYPH|nr:BON domain-containing protein [Rhizobium mesosinicum]MBW9052343.1 BON domain-containing protein [Rhizobium mesosinicum]
MNDNVLRRSVIEELDFEPGLDSTHIAITVEGGIVRLTGKVATFGEVELAERAASRVRGVRGIIRDLVSSPSMMRS